MKLHFFKKRNQNIRLLTLIYLLQSSILLGSLKPSFSAEIKTTDSNQRKLLNNKPGIDYLDKLPSGDYIVGEGDHIRISVSRNTPSLVSEVIVDVDGTIYLPRLKRIYVSGLSISELTNILNQRFLNYVKNPEVDLSIIKYRPVRIFIDGEVESPGFYTFSGSYRFNNADKIEEKKSKLGDGRFFSRKSLDNSNTLFPRTFDAIRQAGGITLYSDLSKVTITRINTLSNGGGRIKTNINFLKVINTGDNTYNLRLKDGDIITIPKGEKLVIEQISKAIKSNLNPKYINVLVSGRVLEPGTQTLSKSSTLKEALEVAGGTKILKGKVKFIRYNNDGSIDRRLISVPRSKSKRGSYQNPFLKDGDIIVVERGIINKTNEFVGEFTSPFVGIYSSLKLWELIF